MSGPRPGACGERGPRAAHCTDYPGHRYSCYDAGEDVSFNDGQWRDGWYDEAGHTCDDPACENIAPIPDDDG
ncbi:hypothetical protein [Nocardioides sp. ChNu-99]|uniref:hypothetical protein n=1 Tax=Nocardioides sp. ChNu-99 TaxID=2839897 RepID=UPI002406E4DA|nr:hypothetical protein [Nocardioides sp. ChNu-99]MDF9716047.1 hypothetical protein [Nocardioides sp. ChNu-99]